MIIPSIDLMDGKAVQLRRGSEKILEVEHIYDLAKKFNLFGEVAVIDLDAALGNGDNLELIKDLCGIADCRVGGGIRTIDRAEELLRAGATKIIIGTKATPEFLKKLPRERLIVAIDTKGDEVVTEGWTKKTGTDPITKILELENYCSEFLFTDVNREGMLQGIALDRIESIRGATSNKITIAGGITSKEDVKVLEDMDLNQQIGMAVYTGKLDLVDAFVELMNFDKYEGGFIPTVVQDISGQVLMVASSTKESLELAFHQQLGTYFSRSRSEIWTKGMTSGNTQELIKIRYDCDRDALLFTVKQTNFACHKGTYSCFSAKEFSIDVLYDLLLDRKINQPTDSYTNTLLNDPDLLMDKIREESNEVINFEDRENLIWEIADLSYFVMVLMVKNGITPSEIKNELRRRMK